MSFEHPYWGDGLLRFRAITTIMQMVLFGINWRGYPRIWSAPKRAPKLSRSYMRRCS